MEAKILKRDVLFAGLSPERRAELFQWFKTEERVKDHLFRDAYRDCLYINSGICCESCCDDENHGGDHDDCSRFGE
jgi:hypothetical protein